MIPCYIYKKGSDWEKNLPKCPCCGGNKVKRDGYAPILGDGYYPEIKCPDCGWGLPAMDDEVAEEYF